MEESDIVGFIFLGVALFIILFIMSIPTIDEEDDEDFY